MTGIYLRVQRGTKWKNIELEHLTKKEQKEILGKWDIDALSRTFSILFTTMPPTKKEMIDLCLLLCHNIHCEEKKIKEDKAT